MFSLPFLSAGSKCKRYVLSNRKELSYFFWSNSDIKNFLSHLSHKYVMFLSSLKMQPLSNMSVESSVACLCCKMFVCVSKILIVFSSATWHSFYLYFHGFSGISRAFPLIYQSKTEYLITIFFSFKDTFGRYVYIFYLVVISTSTYLSLNSTIIL